MELLAILFWCGVIGACVTVMLSAKKWADILFPLDEKRPGGAGTPTKGKRHMTEAVYQITKEMSSGDWQGYNHQNRRPANRGRSGGRRAA